VIPTGQRLPGFRLTMLVSMPELIVVKAWQPVSN
jgi:hypothetical protein